MIWDRRESSAPCSAGSNAGEIILGGTFRQELPGIHDQSIRCRTAGARGGGNQIESPHRPYKYTGTDIAVMVMSASMTGRGVVGIGLMIVMPVLVVMIAIRVMVEIQGHVAEQHVMMLTAKQVLDSANGTGNGRL